MGSAEIYSGGWFPHIHRPYKTKGLALHVSYAHLHPYLRCHAAAANASVSYLRIFAAVELVSIRPTSNGFVVPF